MEKIVGDYLSSIELGDLQQYKNMAVFPLFTSLNHGPEYLTLKEALALGVDGLQLDGLLARFKQMPHHLQFTFLEIIKKHLDLKD